MHEALHLARGQKYGLGELIAAYESIASAMRAQGAFRLHQSCVLLAGVSAAARVRF
jgi:hypothetical protein